MERMTIDHLTEEMVNLRARGRTWAQISLATGIQAAECAARVSSYLNDSYSVQTVIEWRMLQVRRLELIMNALWDQVQEGDLLNEGKAAPTLIKLIEQITELMDLKKDRLRDEQVRLTQAQTFLIMATLDAVKNEMLNVLLQSLPPELHHSIEEVWYEQFAMIADNAIQRHESTVIQMGPGAKEIEPPTPTTPTDTPNQDIFEPEVNDG